MEEVGGKARLYAYNAQQ